MVRCMSAKEARDNFADVLGTAYYKGEPVIVEKKGKPFAVVISPSEYERYQQLARDQFFRVVDEIREKNRDKDPDDVLSEVTEVVEEVRQEMYEQHQQGQ